MQEELKRRESRWSAASTRSRQRIEALEQEKRELQDEIKLLEKYRLQHWREEELAKVRLILFIASFGTNQTSGLFQRQRKNWGREYLS